MKRIIMIILGLSILTIPLFAEYPPEGWTVSITDAIAQAEKEDKMILLAFIGSDWCSWCQKLDSEIWGTQIFESWAEENVVRAFLDFPRTLPQSDETISQNRILQQMLGVRGYPTIWLLDNDLTPLLRTGYREGGPEEYIRHLKNDHIDIDANDADEFRKGFRGGIEEHIGPIG